MTRTEFVAIAIRFLVIWLLIQGLALLAFTGVQAAEPGRWIVGGAILLLLFITVCTMTWRLATLLAGKILPEGDPGDPVTALSKQDLEWVAFRVLGAFFVVTGVSGVGGYFLLANQLAGSTSEGSWSDMLGRAEIAPGLAQLAVQLTIGAGLFMGSSGLRRIWQGVRGSSQDELPPEDTTDPSEEDEGVR